MRISDWSSDVCSSDLDDAEADARLEIYWSALRDIPLPDLRQAYDRLLKTSRFFPSIEEIRAAAHPSMSMRSYKRMRMQMLITRHDREWQPAGAPLTDAEPREMQQIIPGSAVKHRRTATRQRRSDEQPSDLHTLTPN